MIFWNALEQTRIFFNWNSKNSKKFEFSRENAEPKEEKFFFFQATNKTLFKLVKKPNNEKVFWALCQTREVRWRPN